VRTIALILLAGLLVMCVFGFWLRFQFLRREWRAIAVNEQEDRRRRGLCVKCGYDLTGNTSGVCPECGTPLPAEAKA
jgi:uncharacterized paraquat-inducible protein A